MKIDVIRCKKCLKYYSFKTYVWNSLEIVLPQPRDISAAHTEHWRGAGM